MYILDKNKDFYDYFSHVYGEDKTITFDRRGSTLINDENLAVLAYGVDCKYNPHFSSYPEYLILEVGFVQYLIEISNVKTVVNKQQCYSFVSFKSCDMKLIKTYKNFRHYFDSVISIRNINVSNHWRYLKKEFLDISNIDIKKDVRGNPLRNPILASTQLTSLLNPEEIWKECATYISSLKTEKDVNIGTTDIEKVVNHGFDKKTSFRNPIKL